MIVIWQVTEHCNLSCPFCRYDRRLPFARHEARPDELRRVGHLLAEFSKHRNEPVLLSLLGGEPLLWPPLLPLAAELRELGLNLSLTSNGSALRNQRVRSALLADFAELTLSIDGFASLHEKLRGCPGGWQQLKTLTQALNRARHDCSSALLLRANVVLMRDNIGAFADLCHELAHWGFDEISFNQLGGRDRPEFFPAQRLLPEQVLALQMKLPALRAELAGAGLRLLGSAAYLGRFDASSRGLPLPVADCRPGETFLFVDEHNRIAPCSFTGTELSYPLDTIRTLDDLLALPGQFHARRHTRHPAACSDCPSTRVFAKFGVQ
ncbi:MAG: radical SAM protein [Gammaproteobacteria bacterium]|nr:radical SAM protein [Gammaproteobacteria bacterium]